MVIKNNHTKIPNLCLFIDNISTWYIYIYSIVMLYENRWWTKKKWFFDLLSSLPENELFMLFDESEKARGCLISCLKAHLDTHTQNSWIDQTVSHIDFYISLNVPGIVLFKRSFSLFGLS